MRDARVWGLFVGCVTVLGGSACGSRDTRDLPTWTPSDHQPPEGVTDDSQAMPTSVESPGAALYLTHCAVCHGGSGHGDGPGRPPMARVPDLTSSELQGARTDDELAAVIASGRGGFMPGFEDRVSPEGIHAIVGHLRTLRATP